MASAVPIVNAKAVMARAVRSTVDSHALDQLDSYSGRRLQAGATVLTKERCRDSVQRLRGWSRLMTSFTTTEANIENICILKMKI